jgi:hemerythrin-like domain-containing protein
MRLLDHSHESIEVGLLTLEALVQRVAGRDPDARDAHAAHRVLECFDRTAVEHHRDEEQLLFPDLRVRAAAAGRPEVCATLYELEMEHERMERLYADAVRPALEKIAGGAPAELSQAAVAHLSWLYRRHIDLEAGVLEPFAAEMQHR